MTSVDEILFDKLNKEFGDCIQVFDQLTNLQTNDVDELFQKIIELKEKYNICLDYIYDCVSYGYESTKFKAGYQRLIHNLEAHFKIKLHHKEYSFPPGSIYDAIRHDKIIEFKKIYETRNLKPDSLLEKPPEYGDDNDDNHKVLNEHIPDLFDSDYDDENDYFYDMPDEYSDPLIDWVCKFGAIKIFRFLMRNGAELTEESFLFSIKGNNKEIINECLNSKIIQNYMLSNSIFDAIQMRNNELAIFLINTSGGSIKDYASSCLECLNFSFFNHIASLQPLTGDVLVDAIRSRMPKLVTTLVECGYDVNSISYDGTALEVAIRSNPIIAKYLIEKGADVTKGNPLITSICHSSGEDLRFILLEKGANPNEVDYKGNTPIFYAVDRYHYELFPKLVEKGADINYINKEGETPLMRAAFLKNDKAISILKKLGADETIINPKTHQTVADYYKMEIYYCDYSDY